MLFAFLNFLLIAKKIAVLISERNHCRVYNANGESNEVLVHGDLDSLNSELEDEFLERGECVGSLHEGCDLPRDVFSVECLVGVATLHCHLLQGHRLGVHLDDERVLRSHDLHFESGSSQMHNLKEIIKLPSK